MWTIDKSFSFEMGHRVWAQKLEHEHLSLSTECACKHLHGHSYEIKVFLSAENLDSSSMVTDFKNLNFMKQFLDDTLDHKFMIDVNDPLFEKITGVIPNRFILDTKNFVNLGSFLRSMVYNDGLLRNAPVLRGDDEFLDSFVLVDFCPTSENICRHLKIYAQDILQDLATVTALELWETKKSHCRYE
jgi:6-pyruvoyltetrahydropterin/6-carboxytetrahydropterin synthase